MGEALVEYEQKTVQRVFSQGDISAYVTLVRDSNPIYTDSQFAQSKGLERAIVPGGLIEGTLVGLASKEVPGAFLFSQNVRYLKPLYAGDRAELVFQVAEIREESNVNLIRISVEARKGETLYLSGEVKGVYDPKAILLKYVSPII